MLGRDGVEIAVAVAAPVLLVAVEGFPGALQGVEFLARGEVAGLHVAPEPVRPDEGALLAGPQLVHHAADPHQQRVAQGRIVRPGIGEGQGGQVVSRAVTLQLGVRRIPVLRTGIPLRWQAVGVAVIVEHPRDVQRQELPHVEVAVAGQAVVPGQADIPQRQGPGHGDGARTGIRDDGHLGLDRIAFFRGIVAEEESLHAVDGPGRPCGQFGFRLPVRAGPSHLAPFAGPVRVGDADLPRKDGSRAGRCLHLHAGDAADGMVPGDAEDGQQADAAQDCDGEEGSMVRFHRGRIGQGFGARRLRRARAGWRRRRAAPGGGPAPCRRR